MGERRGIRMDQEELETYQGASKALSGFGGEAGARGMPKVRQDSVALQDRLVIAVLVDLKD